MQRHTVRAILIWGAIILSLIYIYPTVGWMTLSPAERQARIDQWKAEDEVYQKPALFSQMWKGIRRWAQFDQKWVINLGLDLKGGVHMVIGLDLDSLSESDWKGLETRWNTDDRELIKRNLQEVALQRVRQRVDEFEAQEPLIQALGTTQIQVQLPGEQDVERAQNLIKRSAFLTFNIVAGQGETNNVIRRIGEKFPNRFLPFMKLDQSRTNYVVPVQYIDQVRKVVQEAAEVPDLIPADKAVMLSTPPRPGDDQQFKVYVVEKEPLITGEGLAEAHARPNTESQPDWMILFKWDNERAQVFYDKTKANLKKPMAIVLDGQVLSAPTIQQAISSDGQITGDFSREQAQDLAIALNSGSMPVPIKEDYAGIVGATLGTDSVRRGVLSGIIGLALVLLIVPVYYRLGGVITDIALVLNTLMLLASMAYLDATLTLPGIAGLILSIGMAVDTNVLVFERMREEMRKGHSLLATIDAGYKRATVTVLDSNLTTLISAAVLMQFGTGPIKGFAVALCIGIVVSLFTSLVITRAIFDWLTARDLIKRLNFMQAIKPDTNIQFMGKRKICAIISTVIIVVGMGAFIVRGSGNFGVDFTTGTNMTVHLDSDQRVNVADVRRQLDGAGFTDVRVQESSADMLSQGSNQFMIHVSTIADQQAGQKPAATEGTDTAAAPAAGETAEAGEETPAEEVVDTAAISNKVQEQLAPLVGGDASKVRTESVTMVGPAVGKSLIWDAVWAVFYSLVFIVAYLWFRFELVFALGAALACIHDVLITMGLFSLFGYEISMAAVASILTVIGYSLNDTIVVFDRIREDMAAYRGKGMTYLQIMDRSINETLSRTLLTAVTTIIVIIVLYLFGGDVLRDFSFILLLGIIFGTYSSVYVASPIAYYLSIYYERWITKRHPERTEVGSRRRPQRKGKPTGEEEATV